MENRIENENIELNKGFEKRIENKDGTKGLKQCERIAVNVRGILARALSISTGSMSIPSNVTLGRFGRKVGELKEPEAEGVEEGVEVAEVAELEICRREPGKKKVERNVSAVDNVECLLYVIVRYCTFLYVLVRSCTF